MSTSLILSAVLKKQDLRESIDPRITQSSGYNSFIERQSLFSDVPVKPEEGAWQEISKKEYNALFRSYTFESYDHLLYFINEVLKSSERVNHHPILKIDHRQVDVTLYTKDFQDVSESDLNLSKIIDEIFEDITYISEL